MRRVIYNDSDRRIIKKILKYLVIIIFLPWLFYHLFLYIDIKNGCFIKIRPAMTELSNTTIKKGIRYLKSNYPDEYVKVCNNVTTIDPNISCGGFGGGCYSEYNRNPGVIDISVTYAKDSIIPWR